MVSATTDRPITVTPQPEPAALIPSATSVSHDVRTCASTCRNQVLTRSSSPSHGVCAVNKNAQVTIRTASTSQAVVVTRKGWGSGGGAPVGRRWRAVRCAGALPGGTAGETMRSLFSLIAHASPPEGATPPAAESSHHALAGRLRLGVWPP
jgi:hypothetical protein